MSWSNTWVGRRKGIVRAFEHYAATLRDQSLAEFERVRPHLEALLMMNHNDNPPQPQGSGGDPILYLAASGHGSYDGSFGEVRVELRSVGSLAEESTEPPAA